MRPLMLLLFTVPLLLAVLILVSAQSSVEELLLPPRAAWTPAHRLRAVGFSTDCSNTLRAASARVATDELADGSIRISCHRSGVRHLPGA